MAEARTGQAKVIYYSEILIDPMNKLFPILVVLSWIQAKPSLVNFTVGKVRKCAFLAQKLGWCVSC
jgi:hypothetical protein